MESLLTAFLPVETLLPQAGGGATPAASPEGALSFDAILSAVSGEIGQDGAGGELADTELLAALQSLDAMSPELPVPFPVAATSLIPAPEIQINPGNVSPPGGQILPLEDLALRQAFRQVEPGKRESHTATVVADDLRHAPVIAMPASQSARSEAMPVPMAVPDADAVADLANFIAPPMMRDANAAKSGPRETARGAAAPAVQITSGNGTRADYVLDTLSRLLAPIAAPQAAPADFEPHLTQALQRDLTAQPVIASTPSPTMGVPMALAEAGMPSVPAVSGELRVAQPINHEAWGEAFSERVSFATRLQLQQADIRLNPPQLGPVEVRISVSQDQTSIAFSSPHAMVRDAIDAALPRLRESLAESGLTLVNVDISGRSLAQDRRPQGWAHDPQASFNETEDFAIAPEAGAVLTAIGNGRLDCFA